MDIFGIKKTQVKAEATIDNINNLVNESRAALTRLDQSQQEIRERMKIYERKAEKAAKIVTTCEIIKTAACLLGAIGIAGVVIGAGYEIVSYYKNKGGEE